MRWVDAPSIATGAYGGILCFVAGIVLGVELWPLLVGCGFVSLVVALAVGDRPELWVALGRRRLLRVPAIAPLVPLFLVSLALEFEFVAYAERRRSIYATIFTLVGLCLVGCAVTRTGRNVFERQAGIEQAAGDAFSSWTATKDPARKRQLNWITVLVGCGMLLELLVVLLYDLQTGFVTSAGISIILLIQLTVERPREYEACEHGLRYSDAGSLGESKQFVPWQRFDGLRETDDAVVLERRRWFDERMDAGEVPSDAREAMRAAIDDSRERFHRDGLIDERA